jgi:hypothetical protein
VREYLATSNDAAFGATTEVQPKFVSLSDRAAQWTGALKGPTFFTYADDYLIDLHCGVIVDVEGSRAIRQAEVDTTRTMIERTEERFGLKPKRLAGDTAYGAAPMLNWPVEEKQIAPHIPVFDRSKREDDTFSRDNLRYDENTDTYTRPAGKMLTMTGRINAGNSIAARGKGQSSGEPLRSAWRGPWPLLARPNRTRGGPRKFSQQQRNHRLNRPSNQILGSVARMSLASPPPTAHTCKIRRHSASRVEGCRRRPCVA